MLHDNQRDSHGNGPRFYCLASTIGVSLRVLFVEVKGIAEGDSALPHIELLLSI
jgi:hypothetical protein